MQGRVYKGCEEYPTQICEVILGILGHAGKEIPGLRGISYTDL